MLWTLRQLEFWVHTHPVQTMYVLPLGEHPDCVTHKTRGYCVHLEFSLCNSKVTGCCNIHNLAYKCRAIRYTCSISKLSLSQFTAFNPEEKVSRWCDELKMQCKTTERHEHSFIQSSCRKGSKDKYEVLTTTWGCWGSSGSFTFLNILAIPATVDKLHVIYITLMLYSNQLFCFIHCIELLIHASRQQTKQPWHQ